MPAANFNAVGQRGACASPLQGCSSVVGSTRCSPSNFEALPLSAPAHQHRDTAGCCNVGDEVIIGPLGEKRAAMCTSFGISEAII